MEEEVQMVLATEGGDNDLNGIPDEEEEEEELYCEFDDVFRVDFDEYEARYHYSIKEWIIFHEDFEEAEHLYSDGDVMEDEYSLFGGKVVITKEDLLNMIELSKNLEE